MQLALETTHFLRFLLRVVDAGQAVELLFGKAGELAAPVVDLARMQPKFLGDRCRGIPWLIRSTYCLPAKFLRICVALFLGHDTPPCRGYLTIKGVYALWVTRAFNARHTGEQLVASPAPQARCAGACYGFQVLLVREACSTSSAFIKAEIIAR